MERWRGRIAVVTGASAGIGAAIVYQLIDAGMTVIALARRVEKIKEAVDKARSEAMSRGRVAPDAPVPGQLHKRALDVANEDAILECFEWIKENFGGVDVLINNAGLTGETLLTGERNTAEWRQIWDVNVLGLSICTREAVNQMMERGIDDGYIIHIGSVTGHMSFLSNEFSMYVSSKHAVKLLAEGVRRVLLSMKSRIRITCVSPGLVKTEILNGYETIQPDEWFQNSHLYPEDVADSVLYVLGTPTHVQIQDIIIRPTGEQF